MFPDAALGVGLFNYGFHYFHALTSMDLYEVNALGKVGSVEEQLVFRNHTWVYSHKFAYMVNYSYLSSC